MFAGNQSHGFQILFLHQMHAHLSSRGALKKRKQKCLPHQKGEWSSQSLRSLQLYPEVFLFIYIKRRKKKNYFVLFQVRLKSYLFLTRLFLTKKKKRIILTHVLCWGFHTSRIYIHVLRLNITGHIHTST